MSGKKYLFVTGDLLKPCEADSNPSPFENTQHAIEQIAAIPKKLGGKVRSLWKPACTELATWLQCQHTPDTLEPYLNAVPDFLESASCVVGWELPFGLQNALDAKGILWLSFTPYIWGPRSDILLATSNDVSLLEALNQPLPRFQPVWDLDNQLRAGSVLIVEPPKFHRSRLREGKLSYLNDCADQIIELLSIASNVVVVPGTAIYDSESFFAHFAGVQPLDGLRQCLDVYFSSPRVSAIASLDSSLAPIAEMFQKPFHPLYPSSCPFAFLPFRNLKSPRLWDEIFRRSGLSREVHPEDGTAPLQSA